MKAAAPLMCALSLLVTVPVGACDGGDDFGCSLIGCVEQLEITLSPAIATPYRVKLTSDGFTREIVCDLSGEPPSFFADACTGTKITMFLRPASSVDVELIALDGSFHRLTTVAVDLDIVEPNGPDCGTCANGTAELDTAAPTPP